MKYNTGDILLTSSNSLLSKIIRKFTKSEYSHIGMVYNIYEKTFIVEEIGNGLCLTPIEDYLKSDKKLLFRRPKFNVDGSEYGKFILPFLGKLEYSFFDLIISQPIHLLTGKWIGSKRTNEKRMICSQFVCFVFNNFTDKFQNYYEIAPSELVESSEFYDL